MIRQGVVSSVANLRRNADDQSAQNSHLNSDLIAVQLAPLSGCGNCSAAGGCGLQVLPASQTTVTVDCSIALDAPVAIGDSVSVRIAEPESGWLRIVGMAYGLPTIGMLIGAMMGHGMGTVLQLTQARELFSLVGFVLGLTGGLIAWDRAQRSAHGAIARQNCPDTAIIVGVVANSGEEI